MKPVQFIIVGGGTSAWMAANLIAKKWFPEKVNVKVVESQEIATVGVGEGSTPTLKRFFRMMEISEKEWDA